MIPREGPITHHTFLDMVFMIILESVCCYLQFNKKPQDNSFWANSNAAESDCQILMHFEMFGLHIRRWNNQCPFPPRKTWEIMYFYAMLTHSYLLFLTVNTMWLWSFCLSTVFNLMYCQTFLILLTNINIIVQLSLSFLSSTISSSQIYQYYL